MNSKKFLEGIRLLKQGLELLEASVEASEGAVAEVVKEVATKEAKKEVVAKEEVVAPTKEEEAPKSEDDIPSEEELSKMNYNQCKSLAKKLGLDISGTKADLIARILGVKDEEDEEDVEAEVEAVEEVDAEEVEAEDEEEEITIQDKVEALVEDMEDTEIADLLTEAGISPKGKRQALIAKLVKAVEEGKIDLEVEEEDEEAEEEVLAEEEEAVEEAETEEDEEEGIDLEEVLTGLELKVLKATAKAVGVKVGLKDKASDLVAKLLEVEELEDVLNYLVENGHVELDEDTEEVEAEEGELTVEAVLEVMAESDHFDFENMSEARKEAIEEQVADVISQYESGDLTIEDMEEIISDFYIVGEEAELLEQAETDEEKFILFIEAYCRLIDEDGEMHEFQEPYEVGEEPYCCGHILEEVKGGYKCPHCEAEYEAE